MLVPSLVPGATDGLIKALNKRHGEIFKEQHIDRVQPFPGATAVIQAVHDRGQYAVLASSADGKEVAHYTKLLDVRSILDATTSIDDARNSKPAGDIFAAALKKVAPLTPAEVIVVGDTPYDVIAAAKCGIAAVAVRSGGFSDAVLLKAGAVALYDDVAALGPTIGKAHLPPLSDCGAARAHPSAAFRRYSAAAAPARPRPGF